jgi:hypothetical protein
MKQNNIYIYYPNIVIYFYSLSLKLLKYIFKNIFLLLKIIEVKRKIKIREKENQNITHH